MRNRMMVWGSLLTLLLAAGCSTMHGFGQDVEKAGEAIQRKSDR